MGNSLSSPGSLGLVALASLAIAYVIWKRSKTPRVKDGLTTVPVKGILVPINFIHRILRGNFGYYLIKFNHANHVKAAKELADMTDTELFGPQDDFVKAVDLFSSNNNFQKRIMSASGTIMVDRWIGRLIETRKQAVKFIQNNREPILKAKLVKPIIVSGLPRTGSTMLYNLLSCDPKTRVPLFFELSAALDEPFNCPKSLEERTNDKRISQSEKIFDEMEKNYPNIFTDGAKSHRTHPTELEEDLFLLFHSFILQIHVAFSSKEYRDFYEEADKRCGYIYHRLFLQMMNEAWTPESHWVLKAPVHSMYMDSLMEQFPDAQVVLTHRNAEKVVPSWGKLMEGYLHWLFEDGSVSKKSLGKYVYESLVLSYERLVEWRNKTNPEVYFDVIYEDFVKDPIGTVENIYTYFGREVTDEFREKMKEWIATNRQGKYGRRSYTLEEFGYTSEMLAEGFPNYPNCFRK